MLSESVEDSAQNSVLCWLGTCSADGQPNVSPKELFVLFDSAHLVIANVASPVSIANLRANPKVCVSLVDIFVQKGFKLIGTARNVEKDDPEFPAWVAPLLPRAQGRFPIQSVIVVDVAHSEEILAPSYTFFPDEVTEESQVASAMQAYGVQPAAGGDAEPSSAAP